MKCANGDVHEGNWSGDLKIWSVFNKTEGATCGVFEGESITV